VDKLYGTGVRHKELFPTPEIFPAAQEQKRSEPFPAAQDSIAHGGKNRIIGGIKILPEGFFQPFFFLVKISLGFHA
jgi:hypothetical protein